MLDFRQTPDQIAHTIALHDGEPVRIHLVDQEATIPVTPCPKRGSPQTDTVPLSSITAVVNFMEVADGGETVWWYLDVPPSEWDRIGLSKHWEHENAEDRGEQRVFECWASRFNNYGEYEDASFTPDIPDDSPLITESEYDTDTPPAPLSRPTLQMEAMHADDVMDFGNTWNTVDVGDIAAVEPLDSIDEQPESREDPRDFDFSPPPSHPDIEYEAIDPIPQTEDVLDAVLTINRHAKRLSEDADRAYQSLNGAEARVHAVRKKALYAAKTVALHRLAKSNPDSVDVEKHTLGGPTEFWCLYFETGHSFHQPADAVEPELLDAVGMEALDDVEADAIDLDSSGAVDDLPCTLETALHRLADYDVNANEYLDATRVEDYDWGTLHSTEFDCLN